MNDWKEGNELNEYVKERYFDICYAQYRVIRGECFGFAGISILIGTSGAVISSAYRTVFIILFALLTVLFLLSAKRIRKQAEKDLMFIPLGQFQWKFDTVRELLPDRYPHTCKIVADSAGETCIILQNFFYFQKEGTGVYLIKPNEGLQFSDMAMTFCKIHEEIQAFIA